MTAAQSSHVADGDAPCGREELVRYRQLEYYRMPYMAYLALDRADTLSRSIDPPGVGNEPA